MSESWDNRGAMTDKLEDLRKSLKELSAGLNATIEQAFHAHKLAEQCIAAAEGRSYGPQDELHIENSKREILRLLEKANKRLQK